MGKVVWLASYPKSGNTWVRVLLANYLRGADEPVDINQMHDTGMASARILFDEYAGIEASALEANVIERLRPEVYRCLAQEASGTLYFKVHDAWGRTDSGEPLFPAEVTAAVVYIVRNPLDVVLSAAHHWGVKVSDRVARLCDPDFALARYPGEVTDQLRQHLGSWSDHVQSWLDAPDLPVLQVRYEDLKRDTQGQFRAILRHCGLQVDEERLRRAVEFSDFRELQRQERQGGFRERPAASTAPFFRSGRSGSWRDELPSHLVQQIIATHGPTMRRCGYLDAENNPV